MNGSTQKLLYWIMGTLLVFSVGLSSALLGMIKSDIDRMDQKIDLIQREYSRIAVVESKLEELLRLSQ